MAKIIGLNKPFGVICQFSGHGSTLAKYIDIPNIYPAGRLDKDSEVSRVNSFDSRGIGR